MTKRRAISLFGILLVAAAGVAAALLLSNRREVTTSSEEAYRVYRQAIDNERAYYFREARVGFARALELDPEFAMAMLGLARHAEKEQALALVHRAARFRSRLNEREQMRLDLQTTALEKGREKAVEVARRILQRYPGDFHAASHVAAYEKAAGRPEVALQVFARLLEVDPNNAEAYNMIGYYHAYRGDYDTAIANLKKYQFMAPDQANPYDSLGEVQAYSGRYDEAIANLEKSLSIKPDFYAPHDHLGVAYEGKGEWAKAIESYRKAAQHAIVDGERFGYLAKALRVTLRSGDAARGNEIFAQLEALPRADNEMSELRLAFVAAAAELLAGRAAEAESKLDALKPRIVAMLIKQRRSDSYKPYDAGWNYLMARAKVALGKEDEAIQLYGEMANPPNGWVDFEERRKVYEGRAELAALLAKRGELERAEKLLEENHRWNPRWAPSRAAEQVVAQLRRERVLASAK